MKDNYSNLDILRAMAVMSVVTYHLWRACVEFHLCRENLTITHTLHNVSYTGVMFFFVHTSLVLMLSLHRSQASHRGAKFLIRRAFRIYPLCWATIFLALATGLTDHPENNLRSLGVGGVAANLLLVQNIFHTDRSAIGPLWSLPWEVQMYLLLPVIFALLLRFKRNSAALSLWLGATALAVAATQPGIPSELHLHAAVFPPMFIAGIVAYRLLDNQKNPFRHAPPAWAWPFFVFLLFALQSWSIGYRRLESPFAAGVDASVCLLLALAIPLFPEMTSRSIVRPAHYVAKYSYGIYLLHVPALMFVMHYMHSLPLALKMSVFLLLTAFLSVLSFHAIEDPLVRMGKRITQQTQSQPTPGVNPDRVRGETVRREIVEGTFATTPQVAAIPKYSEELFCSAQSDEER